MLMKFALVIAVVGLVAAVSAAPALASDHLFNASHSSGIDQRGFVNPVANNPSATSGAMARPGLVPGEGNPNMGVDQKTPAVNLSLVDDRSGGHGTPLN